MASTFSSESAASVADYIYEGPKTGIGSSGGYPYFLKLHQIRYLFIHGIFIVRSCARRQSP
jgi:hypothetical protein